MKQTQLSSMIKLAPNLFSGFIAILYYIYINDVFMYYSYFTKIVSNIQLHYKKHNFTMNLQYIYRYYTKYKYLYLQNI